MHNVTILGSTGSIGKSTLDVINRSPERFRIFALTANDNDDLLLQQCLQFKPRYAVLVSKIAAARLEKKLHEFKSSTKVLVGNDNLIEVAAAPEVDIVMAAIVGAVGLMPTLAAAKTSKRVLLANKEALVMSGALFMDAIRHSNATLLPIDSEHNALFQCMPAGFKPCLPHSGIKRLLLTASGGPFLYTPLEQLNRVTPDQAVAHPNWRMGQKVSIDSATMLNKALEVIEARWLFDMPANAIDVVLHPQSIVHSMVEYQDGSVLAQMGNPDMRTPIAQALAWPDRISSGVGSLDLIQVGKLDFAKLDVNRFPGLELAYLALEKGGTAAAILNAANEVAVKAFIRGQISFTDIARLDREILIKLPITSADCLANILTADTKAREAAKAWIDAKVGEPQAHEEE